MVCEVAEAIARHLSRSPKATEANQLYSAIAADPGIVGLDSAPRHFGSPFNFPDEFVTVYRLHPVVPAMASMSG